MSSFDLLFTLGKLLLHNELLTLLFNGVCAVERLKLALKVLEQGFLLLLGHTFILIALLDLLLLLLDTITELLSFIIELLLHLLLSL